MPYEPLEDKRLYRRAEQLADEVWEVVLKWGWFERKSVGIQLARAADSIGANIAEAGGRFHPGDLIRFYHYARGSLTETRYWLRRGLARHLMAGDLYNQLDGELTQLCIEINQSIAYQRKRQTTEPPNHPTT